MVKMTRRFPQLFIAVYTGSLGEVAHLRQFGFWLLNRSVFEDAPVGLTNSGCILLTIDPDSKAAGIVYGYSLDPFLEESDTFDCLSRAHFYWLEGRYADGLLRVLAQLDAILSKRSRQAQRDPERFRQKVGPIPQVGDLARRIRAGQNPSGPDDEVTEVSR